MAPGFSGAATGAAVEFFSDASVESFKKSNSHSSCKVQTTNPGPVNWHSYHISRVGGKQFFRQTSRLRSENQAISGPKEKS